MGLGRYLVDAVVFERRRPSELAKQHGVSRSWLYELVARYREGGHEALAPRSRRPRSCPLRTPPALERAILRLRRELTRAGHDAGPHTIAAHLARRAPDVPAVATIWRILRRRGLITPEPHKRPRSSFTRFQAALPNELWQGDTTHWRLADGRAVEILNYLDDHSRFLVASVAFVTVKAADVVAVFAAAAQAAGLPASILTDNGAVFSGASRQGEVLFETELSRLGIHVIHSTPYHPQTTGKVERFHQTLKRYLAAQPRARTLRQLQRQLDRYRPYYNAVRPHRALKGRTPASAFAVALKVRPLLAAQAPMQFRVRQDRVDDAGRVTLRYLSRLRHIYVGRAHRRERIRMLVAGANVRIVSDDGELLRELRLDPRRGYQPRGGPEIVHDVSRQVSSMS